MTQAELPPFESRSIVCVLFLLLVQGCGSNEPAAAGNNGADGGGTDATAADTNPNADPNADASAGPDTSVQGDSESDVGPSSDGASFPDAGGAPEAGCVPGCPASIQCGLYTDCTGATIACGKPCAKGESCIVGLASQTCRPTPPLCAGKCGVVAVDACGVAVGCGGCPAGDDCVKNTCVPQTTMDAGKFCNVLACSSGAQSYCGTITDGCGHTKQCSCPAGQTCVAGLCQTPPPECSGSDGGVGATCGSLPNACGSGSIQCGGCAGSTSCQNNVCTACAPPSCNGAACGEVSNGCGRVNCGTCSTGEDCYGGSCCKPLACADFPDAGCAPVDLGCGQKTACYSCPASDFCTNNACMPCQAKTCSDYGNAGCGHEDGCGHKLDCCPLETTCQGTICCPTGQVNYQGTCCQPQCDSSQPPGPQVSCGQIVLCSN